MIVSKSCLRRRLGLVLGRFSGGRKMAVFWGRVWRGSGDVRVFTRFRRRGFRFGEPGGGVPGFERPARPAGAAGAVGGGRNRLARRGHWRAILVDSEGYAPAGGKRRRAGRPMGVWAVGADGRSRLQPTARGGSFGGRRRDRQKRGGGRRGGWAWSVGFVQGETNHTGRTPSRAEHRRGAVALRGRAGRLYTK